MSNRKGKSLWCRHFTGIQNKVCKAGIPYDSVRDGSGPGMYQWPCLEHSRAKTTCDKLEWFTPEEIEARERRIEQAVKDFEEALKNDRCPQCGKPLESKEQIGPCVYGRPCGHRLYQGTIS